jgi:hypothetical protein
LSIHRKTRQTYSSKKNIRIILAGLRGEESISPSLSLATVHSGYRAAMDLGKDVDLAERYGKREHPKFTS